MTIQITQVQPSPHELRVVRKGWGRLHWVCGMPAYIFPAGFLIYGAVVTARSEDASPPFLFSGLLIACLVIWRLTVRLVAGVARREAARAPAGGLAWDWSIDDQAMVFTTGLQTNRVDLRAVMAVREDRDRFVFLVMPGYNPVLPKRCLTPEQSTALILLIDEVRASGRLGAGPSRRGDQGEGQAERASVPG